MEGLSGYLLAGLAGFGFCWLFFRALDLLALAEEEQPTTTKADPMMETRLRALELSIEDLHDRLLQWQGREHGRRKKNGAGDPIADLRAQYPTASEGFIRKKAQQLNLMAD